MQASPDRITGALPAGTAVGEYVLEHTIGEGGMATVYSAVHPIIGKRAAVKVIKSSVCSDPTTVERFQQEARAVNQIGHPNIVDIFSIGRLDDGRSYFIMELLAGETLGARLAARRLTLAEILPIVVAISDALEAAHERGIVHRDVKPENVFLTEQHGRPDVVKLLDFGIAKLCDKNAPPGTARLTVVNLIMGTPEYLSPEQARAQDVDHRTDIYSLGVMLFEMVLGRLPFEAPTAVDFLMQHISQTPPRPSTVWPEIPPSLERLLVGMLEKDPARRPSLSEVRRVLADLDASGSRSESWTPPRSAAVTADMVPAAPPTPTTSGLSGELNLRRFPTFRSPRTIGWAAVGATAVLVAILLSSTRRPPFSDRRASAAVPAEHAQGRSDALAMVSVARPGSSWRPPVVAAAIAEPSRAHIVVHVQPTSRVVLDGNVVAALTNEARLPVDASSYHTVHVSAPGWQPFQTKLVVAEGQTRVLRIALLPISRETTGRKTASVVSRDRDYIMDPFGKKR